MCCSCSGNHAAAPLGPDRDIMIRSVCQGSAIFYRVRRSPSRFWVRRSPPTWALRETVRTLAPTASVLNREVLAGAAGSRVFVDSRRIRARQQLPGKRFRNRTVQARCGAHSFRKRRRESSGVQALARSPRRFGGSHLLDRHQSQASRASLARLNPGRPARGWLGKRTGLPARMSRWASRQTRASMCGSFLESFWPSLRTSPCRCDRPLPIP